jgi:hypothetical protein
MRWEIEVVRFKRMEDSWILKCKNYSSSTLLNVLIDSIETESTMAAGNGQFLRTEIPVCGDRQCEFSVCIVDWCRRSSRSKDTY